MRLVDRFRTRGDPDEQRPDVRALHDAMKRAADGAGGAQGDVYSHLAHAKLWVYTIGTATDPERLRAQADLSGHVTIQFRVGRFSHGAFIACATTPARLAATGLGQPGDDMMTYPIQLLAWAARDGGHEVWVNPGSVPFGVLAGPVLASFADGLVPSAIDPEGQALIRTSHLAATAISTAIDPPAGLVETLAEVLRREPAVRRAVLIEQRLDASRVFMLLVVMDPTQVAALRERVGRRAAARLSPDDYFALQQVDEADSRLTAGDGSIEALARESFQDPRG